MTTQVEGAKNVEHIQQSSTDKKDKQLDMLPGKMLNICSNLLCPVSMCDLWKQVDVVVPLKTSPHVALPELDNRQCLSTIYVHSVIILFWNLLNDWHIFYSLFITLFFENSSDKVSSLLFIFVCQIMGHAHFANNEIRFSCEPDRPTLGFFNFMMPEKSTRNLLTQSLWWFATPGFSTRKEIHLWAKV